VDEFYVAQFITSYFTGVTDIDFFPFKDQRQLLIRFASDEALKENVSHEKMQVMRDLFLIDPDNCEMMVDRDKFETVMFFTATQGAITGMITEYANANRPVADPEVVEEVLREIAEERKQAEADK
jgi:hypothetical protein